jgi:hypothetical protein
MISTFLDFVGVVVDGDVDQVSRRLAANPALATTPSDVGATRQEASTFFFKDIAHYLYAGDTALHMAAAAWRRPVAQLLIVHGADCRARNRRGAEPLHYGGHQPVGSAGPGRADRVPLVRWRRSQRPGSRRRVAAAQSGANAVAGGSPSAVGWRGERKATEQGGIDAVAPRRSNDRARRERLPAGAGTAGWHRQAVAGTRRQGDRSEQSGQDGA